MTEIAVVKPSQPFVVVRVRGKGECFYGHLYGTGAITVGRYGMASIVKRGDSAYTIIMDEMKRVFDPNDYEIGDMEFVL